MPDLGLSIPVGVVRQPRGPGSSGDRGFPNSPNARKSSTPPAEEERVYSKGAAKSKQQKKQTKVTKPTQQAKSNAQDGLQLAHNLLAKERTEDVMTAENKDKEFADMLLSEPVLAGLKNAGFLKPSPIQLAAIPLAKVGFDLIVQSKSGTGKTAVFVVTALEMMQVEMSALQVLVIAPTREIATQGATVAMQIGAALPDLKMSAFIGGINVQEDKIKLKTCQMAVGTPGRVKQLLEEGFMQAGNIRLVCMDEADKLLEPSFLGDTTAILNLLPVNKQVIALSATYPDQLSKIAERFMRSPHHVRLGKECQVLAGVAQYVSEVEQSPVPARQNSLKHTALLSILSSVSYSQCLVFSNYQVIAQSTADYLNARGFPAIFISAGQDQQRRLQAISTFKKFNCRILCSTDLTARGIDAQNVNLVINLDVPWDHNTYLHRIGRGGRYGSLSVAISLAAKGPEMELLQRIVTKTGSEIRILEEDIPKDLRAIKTKDLPVLEGIAANENEDYKKESFKHKESAKVQNDDGEKKTGKVKRRGKKKGKVGSEETATEDNANVEEAAKSSDEVIDTVDTESEDTLTSAYDLLQKHLAVKQKRNLDSLPTFDGIKDLVKATMEGKSVNWNFNNDTEEVKDDNLKEQIGKAAQIVAEHNKTPIKEMHNAAVAKMRNCNLNEIVEKLIAGENINVEPEPVKNLNNSKALLDEGTSNTGGDDTEDSQSDSSSSSSSSDSSSSDSSSDDEQPTAQVPGMSGYPQMPGYPPQTPGYPPQMSGYPPQMPGYPPQMPGYPQSQGYPQMAGYEAWYQQWAASVRQQRDYVQYCHYWQQMQAKAAKK